MKRILQILRRYVGKVAVAPARTDDDVDAAAGMGLTCCMELGIPVRLDAVTNLRKHIRELMAGTLAAVLVAKKGEEYVGMVCCGICPPDPWGSEHVMAIWLLWVERPHRRNAAVVAALLRCCWGLAQNWKVTKVRIAVDERHGDLVDRYESHFGLRREFTSHFYSISTEE